MTDFGSRSTAMEVAAAADLHGQTVLVTGASSGLGVETARALAAAGADLILAVRDVEAGERIADRIRGESGGDVFVGALDLSDLHSVSAFGGAMRERLGRLDVLVANAGVSRTPDWRLANGLDVRFATNHLGHFLLAHLLLGRLAARAARIVMLSSAAHKRRPIQLDDLQGRTRPRDDFRAYGESKTANILFAIEATRRWSDRGIFANAVLPGSALTGLQRHHDDATMRAIGFVRADGSLNPIMKTIEQGAATTVWAATAPELEGRGGLVLEDCAEALVAGPETHPWSGVDPSVIDPEAAVRLWDQSRLILERAGIRI